MTFARLKLLALTGDISHLASQHCWGINDIICIMRPAPARLRCRSTRAELYCYVIVTEHEIMVNRELNGACTCPCSRRGRLPGAVCAQPLLQSTLCVHRK